MSIRSRDEVFRVGVFAERRREVCASGEPIKEPYYTQKRPTDIGRAEVCVHEYKVSLAAFDGSKNP